MRKLFFILFYLILISSSAQIPFQNLAVRKPLSIDSIPFKYTGAIQKFIVPNNVTSIKVQAIGAKGGTGGGGQTGGAGANITTTLNVTSGQVLYIVVGGFPGQSATAKYGFGGNGGSSVGSGFGGAGGGLSGVFTNSTPTNANALVVAGGGGGGAGFPTGTNYTGGAAANSITGTSSNGNGSTGYLVSGKYQYGYAASTSAAGLGGNAFDVLAGTASNNGNDISGGAGGSDGGTSGWYGGGGGGAGYFGGGSGAGGGNATGGGAGGSTKSTSNFSIFGTANSTGDGSVTIICLSNSGLVLNLDAGNTNSYSGTGTAWKDLSGNSPDATLTSTTFSSSNGGNIIFDGTSSYALFNANIGNTNVVTVEMWVKTVAATGGMYFGFKTYDAWNSGGNLGYNSANSDQYGFNSTQYTNLGILGNWKHLVFVMYSGSNTNNKIYVNTTSQSMSALSGYSLNTQNAEFNAGSGKISGWTYPGQSLNWLMNMQVAIFKVYNRELTSQEIINNFNAQRFRFGQ